MNYQNKTVGANSLVRDSLKVFKVSSFVFIAAAFLMSGFFVAPSAALAEHTATVDVSPTLVKGGASGTYSFNISNDAGSANFIYYLKITTPAGFTINDSLICPTEWTSANTESDATCTGDTDPSAGLGIQPGASKQISFSVVAPSSDSTAPWTVQTKDNAYISKTSYPVTTVDATAPTISSITTKDADGDGKVDTATIVFSENIVDATFAPSDFTIGGSTGTSISTGTANDNTFDVVIAGGVAGTEAKDVIYTKSAGAGADIVGNLLADVTSGVIVEIDGAAPVLLSAKTTSTTTITATFSEDLQGNTISNADFSVGGFTLTTPDATDTGTPGVVLLTVSTPFGTGETPAVTYDATISNGVKDSTGNIAPSAGPITPTDGVAPVIASSKTLTTTTIEVTASEAMNEAVKEDFTVAGNTVTNLEVSNSTTVVLTLGTPIGTGDTPTVGTIASPTGTKDVAGNVISGNLTSTPTDGIAPTVEITSTETDPTNAPTIPVTVIFSEAVTDFVVDDITVGNGTASNFEGSGTTYTFDITPSDQGNVTVAIADSVAQDINSNNNSAATQFSITWDTTAPTVTLSDDQADAIVRNADTVVITATFNEAMTATPTISIDAVTDDITDAVMTATGNSKVWTYSWGVPAGNDGDAVVTVAGTDLAGNAYAGADSRTYTIDNTAPTAVESTPVTTLTNDNTPDIGITVESGINWVIKNGTTEVAGGIGNGALQTITLSTLADGTYNLNLIATDTAGNVTTTALTQFLVDTTNPVVSVGDDVLAKALISKTATATDGGSGINAATYLWTQEAEGTGSGTLVISAPNSLTTDISAALNGTEDGTYIIKFTATDNAGNSSSDTFTLTWDTTAPTVALSDDDQADAIVRNADTVVITATFNEAMTATPTISIDAVTDDITDAVMTATGNSKVWTYSWNVPTGNDGSAVVTVAGTDLAGNAYAGADSRTYTIDNTAPTANIASPLANTVVKNGSGNVSIAFDSTGGSVCAYKVGVGEYVSLPNCTSPQTITLTDGRNSIVLKVIDIAGNSAESDAVSFVVDTNNTLTVGPGSEDFATIQGAITKATTNDTISVAAGTYNERLTIDKKITLTGAGIGQTIVQPTFTPTGGAHADKADIWLSDSVASGTTIQNFSFDFNGTDGTRPGWGILIGENITTYPGLNVTDVTIKNNDIQMGLGAGGNGAGQGLGITTGLGGDSSGLIISGNAFHGDSTDTGNGTANGAEAIYINPNGGTGVITVSGNTFDGSLFAGISIETRKVTVDNNTLTRATGADISSTHGIRVNDFVGGKTYSDIVIKNNTVSGFENGLRLGNGSENGSTLTITLGENNIITNNTRGIFVRYDANVTASKNSITGNTTAAEILSASDGTLIAENNYWGTAVANTIDSLITGNVDFDPYYVDAGKTILSSTVPSAVYVDDDYSDGASGSHYFGYDAFVTIQDGIDAVATGGTVNVAEGTYTGDLVIPSTKTNLDISGTSATIVGVSNVLSASRPLASPNIEILGTGTHIHGFTIKSPAYVVGKYSSGIVIGAINVEINSNVFSTNSVDSTDDKSQTIQTYSGVDVSGLNIHNNSFTMQGSGSWGYEGIYINPDAGTGTVTINNNNFTGNIFRAITSERSKTNITNNTITTDAVPSASDLSTASSYQGINVSGTIAMTVTGNTIKGSASGKGFYQGIKVSKAGGLTLSNNIFEQNTLSAYNSDTAQLNAEANYWGTADSATIASNISGDVDYRPWYLDNTLTGLDSTSPTPVISSTAGSLTNTSPIPVTVNFGETVNGFTLDDVSVGNGTAGNFAGSGAAYTFDVTPTGDGAVTIDIVADKAEDASGNFNSAATQLSVTYDTTAPTATVTGAPTGTTNSTTTDITVSGTDVVTYQYKLDSGSYSANTPIATHITLSGLAGGAHTLYVKGSDTAGNLQTDETTKTWTVDITAPVVAITSPIASAKVNGSAGITFTDGEQTAPECSIDNSVWVACTSETTTLGDITGFGALSDGSFNLYLKDTDTAGNTGTTQVALIKDATAPTVTSKTPSSGAVGIDPVANTEIIFSEAMDNTTINSTNITLKKGSSVIATDVSYDTETKKATINPTATLDNNSTYTVNITTFVKDTAGNAIADSVSWIFTTSASYSITLTTGWNLFSLPVVPTDTTASAVLGTTLNDATKIETVWKYDPVAGEWGAYHPGGSGTSNFSTMTAGEGYWINYLPSSGNGTIAGTGNLFQEGNSTPPQKTLAAGWNLIGYYQLENVINTTATKALSTVSGQWTQLRTYDNTAKQFQAVTGGNEMKPGEGYWIFMKSSSYAPYLYGPGDTDI